MICKNCKAEIDNKAAICTSCGCKVKKPLYKKWWFWLIIAAVLIIIASSGGKDKEKPASTTSTDTKAEIAYEAVDLKTMIDDLKANALKAETNYNGKYIEFTAKISNFDSDGKYISVEPTNADEFDFTSVMCNIKNEDQKEILLEKSVGDTVKIKGKVKSVGEVLGYSIDIDEVE